MALVVVCSTKGGVGKSTIATEIAARASSVGHKVFLADMDAQEHSKGWCAQRTAIEGRELPEISCVGLVAPKKTNPSAGAKYLRQQLRKAVEDHDLVVADVGGFDSVELRAALLSCTLAVVPIIPSQWNVEAWMRLRDILEEARITNEECRVLGAINMVHPHRITGANQIKNARSFLGEYFDADDYQLADSVLRSRAVFVQHREDGVSLSELEGKAYDPKADQEMSALYKEVIDGLS